MDVLNTHFLKFHVHDGLFRTWYKYFSAFDYLHGSAKGATTCL